jgi:hypothetical protein
MKMALGSGSINQACTMDALTSERDPCGKARCVTVKALGACLGVCCPKRLQSLSTKPFNHPTGEGHSLTRPHCILGTVHTMSPFVAPMCPETAEFMPKQQLLLASFSFKQHLQLLTGRHSAVHVT